jgi:regulator of ribonuclease E activity RraA/HMG-CHA aldolase family protein
MPLCPDMIRAISAEGKAEGRVSGNNSWPINELQIGDVYVADGFGKIVEGTLIGSNFGNGIAAHTHTGLVFDAGIRDAEENREIPKLNGFHRGYDPSAWAQMTLTSINAPIGIGRATVLPGDLVLAKTDGVIFYSSDPRRTRDRLGGVHQSRRCFRLDGPVGLHSSSLNTLIFTNCAIVRFLNPRAFILSTNGASILKTLI